MAALPAQNAADCYEQMADLAKAAPQSVTYLASKLHPVSAAPVSNNILEYAISGVVRYATDPANAEVKENVNIPVIGNGDIKSCFDAKGMLDETGCDAVMLGRATLGNPWLIRDCVNYLEDGTLPYEVTMEERMETLKKHIDM